ncbi:MAG TPA: hypothetical protein VJ508_15905, partial [Saprospiraceae bacterium]|nr:hypothetical protein [Saprospiraceae bacterium]
YSKGSLIPDDLVVNWRLKGDQEWKQTILKPTAYLDQYEADIPGGQAKVAIEYYVSAHSNWGTKATMPATAPNGFYSFTVN